ncbi:MAG TPA: FAD-dependent monooxygenase, partial [Pararhizobium sp.]|nr:FAD-dependent monooxygenase [Pararhizobium sp.]
AYNIPNAPLIAALMRSLEETDGVVHFDATAANIREADQRVELELNDGTHLSAPFIVGADGRRSRVRKAAGIGAQTWRYPQAALVTTFSHKLSHENASTEFHTEHGPFTQVPLPGRRSSLVWVMEPKDADILMMLGLDILSERIEERMQSMLGAVEAEEAPQRFPLSGLIAHRYGRGRIALVGEAAHVFPPIGAQGLNLALRDVLALSKAADSIKEPRDVPGAVSAYNRARRVDVVSRTAAVDMLNRSLLSSFLPLHLVRSAGLVAISEITPLRSIFMREGMRPGDSIRAMRGLLDDRLRRARDRAH